MPFGRMVFALNAKEKKVHGVLAAAYPAELTLSQIAVVAWGDMGSKPRSLGYSWVWNSMRKLVRLGLAERAGSGYKSAGRAERTQRTQRVDQSDQAAEA